MPKESLRDNLDGNELDLSLNDLHVVPVNELAALPKGTHLDLSCNLLKTISDDFCQLTHLVKLDLSKNAITELPENFGALNKLQHLDLFSNKLTKLPLSLCQLKKLRWLDLKENPLQEVIKKVAGDCLDPTQCRNCAKNMVAFMRKVHAEQERNRQDMLRKERELKEVKKVEEEKERLKKKEEKKIQKERKRKEYEAAQAQKKKEEMAKKKKARVEEPKRVNGVKTKTSRKKEKGGVSCCGVFLAALFGVVAVVIGLYFYCDTSNYQDAFCKQSRTLVLEYYHQAEQLVQQYTAQK